MSCVILKEQRRRKPQCIVKTQITFGREGIHVGKGVCNLRRYLLGTA